MAALPLLDLPSMNEQALACRPASRWLRVADDRLVVSQDTQAKGFDERAIRSGMS